MKDKNLKKLNSNQGEKVSGGFIYHHKEPAKEKINRFGIDGMVMNYDPKRPWEVIRDSDGEVRGRYATKEEAIEMARKKGESTDKTNAAELLQLEEFRRY